MPEEPWGRARPNPGCSGSLVRDRSTMSFNGSNEQPTRLPRSFGEALSGVETAMAVSTDIPGRARAALASRALNRMRTVRRRTILVKLPVALSGGTSANSAPAAGKIASTYRKSVFPDRYRRRRALDRRHHSAHLGLAVIGLDPEIVGRDDGEHARSGGDVFAGARVGSVPTICDGSRKVRDLRLFNHSSACTRMAGGIVMPRAFAVLRFTVR